MTRDRLNKHIRERLKSEYGLEADKELVAAILAIEEDEVYQAIALEDSVQYSWGKIRGVDKPPKRITGFYREYVKVKENGGYSRWKLGYPEVIFSSAAKLCDSKSPQEYFEQPSQRYTTAARTFRKDLDLPEIPEYEGLSEEEIERYCTKADEINFNALPKKVQIRRKLDQRGNGMKNSAVHDYWKTNEYIPMGVPDKDYTGKQRDTIDQYLAKRLTDDIDPVEGLDIILGAKDIIKYRGKMINEHPEVDELEAKFRKQIEEQGLTPKEHKPMFNERSDSVKMSLWFEGEKNPWNIVNTKDWKITTKQSQEQIEMKRQELAEKLAKLALEAEKKKEEAEEMIRLSEEEDKRMARLNKAKKKKESKDKK